MRNFDSDFSRPAQGYPCDNSPAARQQRDAESAALQNAYSSGAPIYGNYRIVRCQGEKMVIEQVNGQGNGGQFTVNFDNDIWMNYRNSTFSGYHQGGSVYVE